MSFENLTERERQILSNLINHYIRTADPVGSRAIATRFKMGISSATIRNTLQDLEELGLVEQPHASAGRIPTDYGYRVYVDYLLKPEQLTAGEKELIKDSILKEGRDINEILGQTAKALGDITNQLGLSVAPRFEEGRLRNLRLIPVTEGKVMVVVIVESGLARTVILEVEARCREDVLIEVESILNERLAGLTLAEIRKTVSKRMADVSGNARLIRLVIDSKDKIWSEQAAGTVRVSGKERLLAMPEFADREKLSGIMKILEEGSVLGDFLSHAEQEGLVITIGRENKVDEIMSCSLVTSSYRVGDITGSIGIIGPTRMPYNKLVSIVKYTAKSITEVLSGIGGSEGA
jgi:heat-inducible transcriptional repressor